MCVVLIRGGKKPLADTVTLYSGIMPRSHPWQPLDHSVVDGELLVRGKGLAHDPPGESVERLKEMDFQTPESTGETAMSEKMLIVLSSHLNHHRSQWIHV